MTATTAERIEGLAPRLQKKAAYLQHMSPSQTSDDLYQEMVMALLDRMSKEPSFVNQKDGYLLQYADWVARKNGQADRTYRSYVDAMPVMIGDDGETTAILEFIASDTPTPEQMQVFAEDADALMSIVRDLSPENQTLVKMLYYGHEQVEIAKVLGITKGAVSQRKKTVARAIASRISG